MREGTPTRQDQDERETERELDDVTLHWVLLFEKNVTMEHIECRASMNCRASRLGGALARYMPCLLSSGRPYPGQVMGLGEEARPMVDARTVAQLVCRGAPAT